MPPRKKAKLNEPPTRAPSPPPTNPDGTPAPSGEHPTLHSPSTSAEPSPWPEPGVSSQVKSENWANLKGLMDTLTQAAGITGFGAVKSVVEGLVELIGLYEDAAQGQKEFNDLRLQLECIFDELKHHLSSSPAITTSIDSICWSVRKEIDVVRTEQARGKKRKHEGTQTDTQLLLECYRRIHSHLQRLTLNANTSAWTFVDQLATDNLLRTLAPSLWPCYNSEKAIELERRQCTEGTRVNVLAHMQKWATAPDTGNVYWMSGMAGTGKTTIAYSLCEWLDAEKNRMLGASFFCSRSLPECRDVGRIIPSIAYQLARYSRPFKCALFQAMEKDPDAHTRMPQLQVDSLIVQPLSDMKVQEAFPASVVVMIDALDECEDTKSTKLILGALLTRSRDLPIKFVVSSRPEPAVRDQMEKNGTWVDARVVLHELDMKTDIKTYLKAELESIEPSDSEIEQLVARAGVLFIYAATVIRYVGYDDFGCDPRSRLDIVLGAADEDEEAPMNDIDDLYATILRAAFENPMLRKKERDNMKLILDTVICAQNPLTVDALNNLLKLGGVARVDAALRPMWSVLHVMGPNMTVTTLHASFPDYLLDSQRSGSWHCDAASHHRLLAQQCFECIQDTRPQFNICRLESSYLLDDEVTDLDDRVQKFIPTELRYACQYWSSHLDASGSSTASILAQLLLQFLTRNLLLWMEVRNLTKTMHVAPGELMVAKQWATQNGMPHTMIELMNDTWRFASTFASSPVSQSTPHIYISMLPLLPSYRPIRSYYIGRFQGMIGIEGSAFERRNDELLAEWKFELGVWCMACSPDGTRVAIGGSSKDVGHIYILDALKGNLLLDLSHDDEAVIHSTAFSPDSTRLASGRSDGMISVWDLYDGQLVLQPFKAHAEAVTSILYSHGGSYIVSASWIRSEFTVFSDIPIGIWDALSGTPALPSLLGHFGEITSIVITRDDTRIISGSVVGHIRVWNLQSGMFVLDSIIGSEGQITALALSPDDSCIVSASSFGAIQVWDIQTGQILLGPLRVGDHFRWGEVVSFSPDGATIVSVCEDNVVQIWDAASGELVSQLGPFSGGHHSGNWATYSPDGTRIILAQGNGVVRLLDTQTAPTPSDPLPGHTEIAASIDISPNCRQVVTGSWDHTLCVWDLNQGTLLVGPLQGHTGRVNMVRFSPDGTRIVSCSQDSTIRQWGAQSGAVCGTPIGVTTAKDVEFYSAAYSPDGTRILSLTSSRPQRCAGDINWSPAPFVPGELAVWDSRSRQCIVGYFASPTPTAALHAAFSLDGTTIIAGYKDGSIGVWDAQNGQIVYSRKGHLLSDAGLSFAFSPDGFYCAQALLDGDITLRNVHTGDQIPRALYGHSPYLRSVRFSRDSNKLVSGSDDKTVHVWDVETGQSLLGPLIGHAEGIKDVVFSPDGKYVASTSMDRVIRVWDIQPKAPSGEDRDTEYADWVLNKDGWVVSGESRRLFWIPSDLHPYLMRPRNTALMSQNSYLCLSFESGFIGEAWANCWRNR